MDTARKLRLMRVLEQQGSQYLGRWEELKYLIAPYVARTAEEQRRFYALFKEFQEECEAEATRWNTEPPLPPPPPTQKNKWRWLWLLPVLLLGLVFYWMYEPTKEPIPVRIDREALPIARDGQRLTLRNKTLVNKTADSTDFAWEVRDVESGEIDTTATDFDLQWVARDYRATKHIILRRMKARDSSRFSPLADTLRLLVHCAAPPVADSVQRQPDGQVLVHNEEYTFLHPEKEGLAAEWIFANKDTLRGFEVTYTFDEASQDASYILRLYREGGYNDCYTTVGATLPLRSDEPYLAPMGLKPEQPGWLITPNFWIFGFSLLFFTVGAYLLYRWWKKRRVQQEEKTRADLENEHPIHDRAPYFIPYLPQEDKIQVPPAFYRIADVLRRREEGQRRVFDTARTIHATAESGGFPSWQDRPLTRPAEYLFLLPQRDEQQQQDRLFQRLATFMEKRDAPLTVFHHRGDFQYFWNEQFPEGLPIDQLYRLFPAHRLVLLGKGHGLVNPYASERPALLDEPLQALLRWSRRLLITPEPVVDWSYQEALLHAHFHLFPADTAGILAGVEALDRDEEYASGSFGYWQNHFRRQHAEPGCRYLDWDSLDSHRQYLLDDPPLFRWLCGLAVNAQPDWALTIAIGRAMGIEVTHNRLLRLSRIPWLASNSPNNHLRLELLRCLSPEEEAQARRAVEEELENVRELIKDSFAEAEWTSNLAVQRFALEPRNPDHKLAIRDLKELGLLSIEQQEELEFIVQERADRQGLPAEATRSLDDWLEATEPQPFWTANLIGGLIFLLLSLIPLISYYVMILPSQEAVPQLAFWQKAEPIDDRALELHNEAVAIGQRMATQPLYTEWSNSLDSVQIADSLLQEAIELRAPTPFPLADSNRIALAYNQSARHFNFYRADSVDYDGWLAARLTVDQVADLLNDSLDQRYWDYLHALGLLEFYQAGDSILARRNAMTTYQTILSLSDNSYFEDLQDEMPVNLETLLGIKLPRIHLRALFLDAETRQPVNQVAVQLPNGNVAVSEGAQLRHQFASEPTSQSGVLSLQTNASGYREEIFNFQLRRQPNSEDTLYLTPLPRDREWGGQVVDARIGAPIAGAIVQAGDANRIRNAQLLLVTGPMADTTNSQGGFTLREIPPEATQLQILVRAPGYKDSILYRNLSSTANIVRLLRDTTTSDATDIDSSDIINEQDKPQTKVPLPDMVRVVGGTFQMGDTFDDGYDREKPVHSVTVSDFYLGRYEVTFAEYDAFCEATGKEDEADEGWGRGRRPVINVSWLDAVEYCNWLSEQHGYQPVYAIKGNDVTANWQANGYRLPTEAEWEFAARQLGQQVRFGNGQDTARVSQINFNGGEIYKESYSEVGEYRARTVPVGSLNSPNNLGLHDMSGNVWEWCWDWYGDYPSAAQNNPRGPESGSGRVLRGGSWNDYPAGVRCSYRFDITPGYRYYFIGFRLSRAGR